jgi:hypothetical protein
MKRKPADNQRVAGGAGNLRVPFTWVGYGSLSTDATIELLVTYIQ